jgi:hypothetical protein
MLLKMLKIIAQMTGFPKCCIYGTSLEMLRKWHIGDGAMENIMARSCYRISVL